MLGVMLGVSFAIGALIIVWLPSRMQPAARLFLAVPLGCALLALVATLLGWFGHGFGGWHCLIVTVLLTGCGVWTGRRHLPGWGRELAPLSAFALLGSFSILAPLMRFGAFCEYNDTFMYLTHAQWLQHHGFLGHAHTEGGHPAWSQIVYFRDTSMRMGASFLLGWMQSAFQLDWSYEVFPTLSALALLCGALSIGGTVLAACPGARAEAWLAALAVAATVNGFAFGAATGFFGQTWGLAFVTLAFALRGLEMMDRPAGTGPLSRWRSGTAVGIAVAAAMHCYWDLAPFTAAGLAASYFVPWPGRERRAWRDAWACAWPALLASVVLVNAEWIRAWRGILINIKLVVANPVNWPLWTFPAHALGLKQSIWEGSNWITAGPPVAMFAGSVVVLVTLGLALGPRLRAFLRRPGQWPPGWWSGALRWRVLAPGIGWLAASALLFFYFRYGVKSPWSENNTSGRPDGVGQSWSQYKLMCWDSAMVIGVAATGLVGLGRTWRPGLLRPLTLLILAAWCGTGLGWNYQLAALRSEELCADAECTSDPFTVCLGIRQLLQNVPKNEWIYMNWPADQEIKYRQLLTYFLSDHSLASDWHDDGIGAFMTPADMRRTPADCAWVLTYHPEQGNVVANVTTPMLGGVTLDRSKQNLFALTAVRSPYGAETGPEGPFYWTDGRVEMDFHSWRRVPADPPEQIQLQFACRSVTPRQLSVEVTSEAGKVVFPVAATLGEQTFTSPMLNFQGEKLHVVITSGAPPVRASGQDPRMLSFLVTQAMIKPADQY
jgi:hypothetical protein